MLNKCIGSKAQKVCYESFATETTQNTCLAALFTDADNLISLCKTRVISLPIIESALNIGQGRWLVTSRSDKYNFKLIPFNSTSPDSIQTISGCKSCVIHVPCAYMLQGPNIRVRPDMATCAMTPVFRKIEHTVPLLADLFIQLMPVSDFPELTDVTKIRAAVLDKLQTKMLDIHPHDMRTLKQIRAIATPIVHKLKDMHYINSHKTDRTWIAVAVIIFVGIASVAAIMVYIQFRVSRALRQHIQQNRASNVLSTQRTVTNAEINAIFEREIEPMRGVSSRQRCDISPLVLETDMDTPIIEIRSSVV